MPVSPIKRQTARKCSGVDSGSNSTLGIQGTCDSKCRLKNQELCRFFPLLRLGEQLSRSDCALRGQVAPGTELAWEMPDCPWARLSEEKLEKNCKRPGIAGSHLSRRPNFRRDRQNYWLAITVLGNIPLQIASEKTDRRERTKTWLVSLWVCSRSQVSTKEEGKKMSDTSDVTEYKGPSTFMAPWRVCQKLRGCSKGEVDKVSRSVRRDKEIYLPTSDHRGQY